MANINWLKTTLSHIQRNHGLEHATLTVLSERYPHKNLAGHSDAAGFWVIGDVETEAVCEAAITALKRLKAGERNLAIHPYCGTNFVVPGVLAATAAWLGMGGDTTTMKKKIDRLPFIITLVIAVLILAQPLGWLFQARVTTSGTPGGLEIERVVSGTLARRRAHRVFTQG